MSKADKNMIFDERNLQYYPPLRPRAKKPKRMTRLSSKPVEVVINDKPGGFELSDAAIRALAKRKGLHVIPYDGMGLRGRLFLSSNPKARPYVDVDEFFKYDSYEMSLRTDPDLVAVVKRLGRKASGPCSKLKVVRVPFDVIQAGAKIQECGDGSELVAEAHRTWG